jgi:hypothetical protein
MEPAMPALDERRSQWDRSSPHVEPSIREAERAWRNDVALEMWIDVKTVPVAIRLEGVLDESTGANLMDVVSDCMSEGRWDFFLDTSSLRIVRSGWAVMHRLREQVRDAGGHLHWDPATVV